VQGGFGAAESMAVLPALFRALADAAPVVLTALTSGAAILGGYAGAAKSVVDLRDALKSRPEEADAPGNPYLPLRNAAQALTKEMQAAGMPADQSELITYRVLMALCEDPNGAGRFVGALHGAPRTR
jgi:hypothetical protein